MTICAITYRLLMSTASSKFMMFGFSIALTFSKRREFVIAFLSVLYGWDVDIARGRYSCLKNYNFCSNLVMPSIWINFVLI